VKLPGSILWPLSVLYGAAAHLRARAYQTGILRQRRLDGVVISVGNLTVGGTGKTPLVQWIAERLRGERKRVGILTRGYRGVPSNSNDGSEGSGPSTSDEVQLLRVLLGPQVSFGVGANRFEKGQELARQGVSWFILDDGFQHLQLARDVDIVLIDATNPFGGGHLLPAGRLREPRTALARADIVVITRSDHAPAIEAAVRRDSEARVFYACMQPAPVRVLRKEYPGELDARAYSKKLFVFCGIGNPAAFVSDLRNWGFNLAGEKFFRDHHRYTQQDLQEIEREAQRAKADGVICTEKDVFNLGGSRLDALEISYCPISLNIQNDDAFWRVVKTKAESVERSHK
jgi:tetraacyldisaccharide 4'-kinase